MNLKFYRLVTLVTVIILFKTTLGIEAMIRPKSDNLLNSVNLTTKKGINEFHFVKSVICDFFIFSLPKRYMEM